MIDNIYKGDSIEFECNAGENITNWKIRCQIWSNSKSIKKATTNSGGSDDQIKITDALNGIFSIYVNKGETESIENYANIEIEMETPEKKLYTVYRDTIKFVQGKIDWQTP